MAEKVVTDAAKTNTDAVAGEGEKGKEGAAAAAKEPTAEEKAATEKAAADKAVADKAAADQKDGKKADDKQADNKDAKSTEVPEKYDLKLPEGTIVDEPMMAEFTTWAKENKFTNEQAQKAAELHMKAIGAFAARQAGEFADQQRTWLEELKADKEIGGAKVDTTLAVARKILGSDDGSIPPLPIPGLDAKKLRAEMNRTGLGNFPEMVKLFHFFGQFVGDDHKWVPTHKPASGEPKSDAAVLYPNDKQ